MGVGDFEFVFLLEGFEGVLDVMGLVVDGDDYFDYSDLGKRLGVGEEILRFGARPWAGLRRERPTWDS